MFLSLVAALLPANGRLGQISRLVQGRLSEDFILKLGKRQRFQRGKRRLGRAFKLEVQFDKLDRLPIRVSQNGQNGVGQEVEQIERKSYKRKISAQHNRQTQM